MQPATSPSASPSERARATDDLLARLSAAMNCRVLAVLWADGVPLIVEHDEALGCFVTC